MNKSTLKYNFSNQLILLNIAFFSATLLEDFIRPGLFMDGLIYSTISKNLAEGIGSFWSLKMTDTLFNPFQEHPPLQVWIMTPLYKLFPDHNYLIEKLFGLFMLLVSIFISFKISAQETGRKLTWPEKNLLILFLISASSVSYIYARNMLEVFLVFFTLLGLYVGGKLHKSEGVKFYTYLLLFILCIYLAFMSKGPVALFMFAFIGLRFLIMKDFNFLKTIVLTLVVCAIFSILLWLTINLNSDSKSLFEYYFHRQIFNSVNGSDTFNVTSRLFTLETMFSQSIIMISFTFIFFMVSKYSNKNIETIDFSSKSFLFYLSLFLCATLPMFLSSRSTSYYIAPSFYCLAIGFFILNRNTFSSLISYLNGIKTPKYALSLVIITLLVIGVIRGNQALNKPRGVETEHDVSVLKKYYKPHKIFYTKEGDLSFAGSLHAYYYREGKYSIEHRAFPQDSIKIGLKKYRDAESIPKSGLDEINSQLKEVYLYK